MLAAGIGCLYSGPASQFELCLCSSFGAELDWLVQPTWHAGSFKGCCCTHDPESLAASKRLNQPVIENIINQDNNKQRLSDLVSIMG